MIEKLEYWDIAVQTFHYSNIPQKTIEAGRSPSWQFGFAENALYNASINSMGLQTSGSLVKRKEVGFCDYTGHMGFTWQDDALCRGYISPDVKQNGIFFRR